MKLVLPHLIQGKTGLLDGITLNIEDSSTRANLFTRTTTPAVTGDDIRHDLLASIDVI
jgi:hypothetical protein